MWVRSFYEWDELDEFRLLGNVLRFNEGRGLVVFSMALKRKYLKFSIL